MTTKALRNLRRFLGDHLDSHSAELVAGSVAALAVKGLSFAATLSLSVALSRILGAANVGLYFLAFTVATIAGMIGRLGMDQTVVRYVSREAARGSFGGVGEVHRKAVRLGAGGSLILAAILAAGAPWTADRLFHDPALAGPLRIMALAMLPISFSTLSAQALQGLKRIVQANVVLNVVAPLAALMLVLALAPSLNVEMASWAYVVGVTVAALLGTYWWRRAAGPVRVEGAWGVETRVLLESGLPLLGLGVVDSVTAWTGLLLLGAWADPEQVGVFAVAQRTAMLISFALLGVNSIAAPKFAELHAQHDQGQLGRTARQAAFLTALLAVPVMLFVAVAPGEVMGVFGAEFREGAAVLVVLALGQFMNAAAGSVGTLLIMTGNERAMRNTAAAAAAVNVALSVTLIPSHGAFGAAVAVAVATTVRNLAALVLVRLRLGEHALPSWR